MQGNPDDEPAASQQLYTSENYPLSIYSNKHTYCNIHTCRPKYQQTKLTSLSYK